MIFIDQKGRLRWRRILIAAGLAMSLGFGAGILEEWRQRATAVAAAVPEVGACDRFAADVSDPERRAHPVSNEDLKPAAAIAACRTALQEAPGFPLFHFQLGRGLWLDGDGKSALRHFMMAAELGHRAAARVAGLLLIGQEAEELRTKGFDYLQAAAESGDGVAQRHLAGILRRPDLGFGDLVAARRWLGEAAAKGDATAELALGEMLADGEGGAADKSEARRIYRKHAVRGNLEAQWLLSQADRGKPGELGEAAEDWLRLAADRGHPGAQYDLALLEGASEAPDRELFWMHRAAERAYEPATRFLVKRYAARLSAGPAGDGGLVGYEDAFSWLLSVAKAGDSEAEAVLRQVLGPDDQELPGWIEELRGLDGKAESLGLD